MRVVALAELEAGDPIVEPLGHRAGHVGVDDYSVHLREIPSPCRLEEIISPERDSGHPYSDTNAPRAAVL